MPNKKDQKEQPRFVMARHKRHGRHAVPCGGACKIYPMGKETSKPQGFLAKVAGLFKPGPEGTKPKDNQVWIQREGERQLGRH